MAGVLTEDGGGEQTTGEEEVMVDGDGASVEGQNDLVPGTLLRKAWVDVGDLMLRLGYEELQTRSVPEGECGVCDRI